MVSHRDSTFTILVKLLTQSANALFCIQQSPSRDATQANDHLWANDFQLAVGEVPTIGNLVLRRVSISGRPALDGIQDINVVAAQLTSFNDPRQQLPGFADKRFAHSIFVGTWSFPQKTNVGRGIANAEHRLLALTNEFWASGALAYFRLNDVQCLATFIRCQGRWVMLRRGFGKDGLPGTLNGSRLRILSGKGSRIGGDRIIGLGNREPVDRLNPSSHLRRIWARQIRNARFLQAMQMVDDGTL